MDSQGRCGILKFEELTASIIITFGYYGSDGSALELWASQSKRSNQAYYANPDAAEPKSEVLNKTEPNRHGAEAFDVSFNAIFAELIGIGPGFQSGQSLILNTHLHNY